MSSSSNSSVVKISKLWSQLWSCQSCCSSSDKTNSKESRNLDKSQATQEHILRAAFLEIYRRGFQAASLSKILEHTGITKGALYHHYENKLVLGYAVVDEIIHPSIYSTWIEPLQDSDDPISALQETMLRASKLMGEEDVVLGCPLNNLAQEMSPIDDGFKDRISAIYKIWQDSLEAAFERGKAADNIKASIDSKTEALLFIASLEGCLGFAKSLQKLEVLLSCGQGLMERLETLRPSNTMTTEPNK